MSLSSAISNALSGVTAASRGTEVVSTNIANKSVAGYARREVELSSRIHAANGGGVSVDGVRRAVSPGLLADNRLAQSAAARSDTVARFHAAMEATLGTADDGASLSSALTALDGAIAQASARPDNDVRLNGVVEAARTLTGKINGIAQTIEDARTAADAAIALDVGKLNTTLERVAELNRQITITTAQGGDASALTDARQAAIDEIAAIVPLQEVARENGRVALFTKGGATLLDGTVPARVDFTPAGRVTADMTLTNGALSTLSLNGKVLSAGEMAAFAGGSIAGNLQVRDQIAPEYQTQIDAFAREIYDRFADPAIDPTLGTGQAGLFTDAQQALVPAAEPGLANRIAIAAAVDPEQGGDLWRIRAGMNATDPGPVGDATLLQAMTGALAASRAPSSDGFTDTPRTLLALVSELASGAASNRLRTDATALQDRTHSDTLRTALLAQGVDTDTEMEALLTLERAYAANAKVLQTANDMLDQILRLT